MLGGEARAYGLIWDRHRARVLHHLLAVVFLVLAGAIIGAGGAVGAMAAVAATGGFGSLHPLQPSDQPIPDFGTAKPAS